MVYLRTKIIRDNEYVYLVKSVWDSKKKTSKQEIVKYLGSASKVSISDIPKQHITEKIIVKILTMQNKHAF